MSNVKGWDFIKFLIRHPYCHNEGRRSLRQIKNFDYCIIGNGDLNTAFIGDSQAIFDAANDYMKSNLNQLLPLVVAVHLY